MWKSERGCLCSFDLKHSRNRGLPHVGSCSFVDFQSLDSLPFSVLRIALSSLIQTARGRKSKPARWTETGRWLKANTSLTRSLHPRRRSVTYGLTQYGEKEGCQGDVAAWWCYENSGHRRGNWRGEILRDKAHHSFSPVWQSRAQCGPDRWCTHKPSQICAPTWPHLISNLPLALSNSWQNVWTASTAKHSVLNWCKWSVCAIWSMMLIHLSVLQSPSEEHACMIHLIHSLVQDLSKTK